MKPLAAPASRTKLFLAFAAVYLIWGSTYLAIRFAVETIPPLLMMGARHLLAGAVLYAWIRLRGAARPERAHWLGALGMGGLLFLGCHGTLAWAEQRVPSGLAAVLCATLPFWTVFLARIRNPQARLSGRVMAGLLMGLAGVMLLFGPGVLRDSGRAGWLPAIVIVLGAMSWAVGSVYANSFKLPGSAVLSAAMQMLGGGALLVLTSVFTGEFGRLHPAEVTRFSVLSYLYLVVMGSIVAFTAFTWLLTVTSPARVSTYAYVNPVVAMVLGWGLAGEKLGWRTLAAAAVILLGVILVKTQRPAADKKKGAPPAPLQQELSLDLAEGEKQPVAGFAPGRLIARCWTGATPAADAQRYLEYLLGTGVKECHATAGNRGVLLLRRLRGEQAEFLFISLWESFDAIRKFAGPDAEKAVYYPQDRAFLLELSPTVDHFEIMVQPEGLVTRATGAAKISSDFSSSTTFPLRAD